MPQPPNTSSIKWTKDQWLGISTVGHSLLVSAAAGSGKTAVLAERCAHLVCSADPPCDVDKLLVVTFTRASAAEMRSRIESSIRKRLEQADPTEEARLTRQVALLDHATIGTLHSFCTMVLREHFHLLGLDPAFTLIEEHAAKLLRLDTARELFAERHDGEDAAAFQTFVDQYVDGNDELLIRRVVSTHDLLCSVVNPLDWRKRAIDRIVEASAGTLVKSQLGHELAADVQDRLADLQLRCIAATQAFQTPGLELYGEHVNELQATVQWWIDCFGDGSFDRLADAVRHAVIPTLPRIPTSTPGKESAQETINSIKAQMKPDGGLGCLCRFSETEWKDGLAQTIEPTQTFLSLVAEFTARFDAAKMAIRSLDFSDLERLTLRVLSDGEEPSAVARLYHGRFKHVLVDEYQDINEVQDRILSLVSREALHKREPAGTNLFCVGDVKQSIYRFRLAEPKQFLNRAKSFGRDGPLNGGQIIDLQTNFRSRAPLLNCLNGLFERLMTGDAMEIKYDNSHRLHPPETSPYDTSPCDGPTVSLHLLPAPIAGAAESDEAVDEDRTQREAGFVARQIRKLIAEGVQILDRESSPPSLRSARYGDVSILLRSMQFKADAFALALRLAGIPVHSDSSTGFFDSMEVRDILSLLAVLDNQQQDIPLAAVLRSPLLGLSRPEDALASARLASPDPEVPFHVAVVQYAESKVDALAAELAAALATLSKWRELANRRPLADALWSICSESGYITFCSGLADGEQSVANLLSLHERAKQFDATDHLHGLGRFRRYLDALRDESDLGQPSVAVEGEDAVRIMSVHRAKGLEFPIVFVPDLGKRHNFQSCAGTVLVDRHSYVGLSVVDEEKRVRYPSLAHAMAKESMRRQTLAEELRVLYVAATRACERLFLVGTCKPATAEEWRTEYAGHVGPLPPGTLLGGQTPLDWLGPAASALAAASPHLISIVVHEEQELVAQQNTPRAGMTEFQEHVAHLRPLVPAPPPSQQADRILRRLDRTYPFASVIDVPAARSVSQLSTQANAPRPVTLALPRTMAPKQQMAATEIGDATHIAMEHIDFHSRATEDEIRSQLRAMVQRRFLTQAAAASVDLAGVSWFINSELGELIRANAGQVRRELPLYFARPSAEGTPPDPLDQTMVRGRIDVLIPLPDRCVLIDFKTDRVTPDAIDAQVEHHRAQISLYAAAIESILHRPVEGYLAFLTPRQSRLVK